MNVIRSGRQMQQMMLRARRQGKTVGFVPTMGALHDGHMSLVKRARKAHDVVVVSIFVNPAQFGPHEDYLKYPRPFAADTAVCRQHGVDVVFAPSPEEMYPEGYRTYVSVEKMSEGLCGAYRPGHFRGVTTVVAKLFNIVQPHAAYFGMKDYQQFRIIQRMVADLHMPVRVIGCPIIRASSGLALSSRNQYLSGDERGASAVIHAALIDANRALQNGITPARAAAGIRKRILSVIPKARFDYISVVDAATLQDVRRVRGPVAILAAVWVGTTRLIDNEVVRP